jgi:hypothetical protein
VNARETLAPRFLGEAACAAVLAAETIGWLLVWPMPFAWVWVGAQIYQGTGSVAAGGAVALAGFVASLKLAVMALTRIDGVWIALRRRAGHEQKQGALTQVVVVSATFGIILFLLWYYVIGQAYVIPFMPVR